MTFRVPGAHGPAGGRAVVLPRWPRYVVPTVIALVVLAILVSIMAGIWTDYLWYSSVGQTGVFATTYSTKWLLFLVTGVLMALIVGANIAVAYRMRPAEPPTGPDHQGVEAYRQAIDPHRRGVMLVILALIGLVSGLAASSGWQTWLLFVNRVPFGVKDPQFHLDDSFYVNVYPFLRMALSFLFAVVLLSLVLAAAVHVLYGGLHLGRHAMPSRAARAHLFLLAGVFVALKAAAYWLDRYGIMFSQRGVVQTGASYTDVNAVLPAKTVLAVIAVICAVLFFAGVVRRSSLLPAIGFGLLVLSAVIIGGVYPFIIQQFVVKPNEQVKERPYIAREIVNTRAAYGVSDVKVTPYPAVATQSSAALAAQAAGVPDFRLQDQDVMSTSFQQLQQVKGYYRFAGVLAMDRYVFGSNPAPQDTVVGVRDMTGPPAGQANWINTHLIYTHGYGIVASTAANSAANGNPNFVEGDIPPKGPLVGYFQPRVYFGHEGAGYVIVDTRQKELDYPNQSTGGQQNYTYHGGGGVSIGSFARRLLFAIRFRELNILLSSAIDTQARILYIRDPLARVAKVAPFLTLDGDPYPVAVDGKLLWVVDGYTTTDNYPYSKRIGLNQATTNTYSQNGLAVGPDNQVNYVRNSVKATVNAFTGAVHLYQWGQASPILRSWMKTFPGLISPQKDIPLSLMPHLRYPEVLFDVQRQILAQFHVQQPAAFYGGQNFWAIPNDPSQPIQVPQPPYYMTVAMPGQSTPEFSLTGLFTQRARPNLAGYMAVESNPTRPGYGHITILQLPQDTAIPGPEQVQSQFESNSYAAKQLTLLRGGGSKVALGNLVTVPIGGSLLSVEPVYVLPSATTNAGAYPLLQEIFSFYYYGPGAGGKVGFASTLAGSLAQVFGSAGQAPGAQGGAGTGHLSAVVLQFLAQAQRFYNQAQDALRTGNLGLYYQDILKMKDALDQATNAAKPATSGPGGRSPSASPSPSGRPAPSATPSSSP
ncbi:MAG TPA: UPF0182 family protein [Streptosporangiaceae bacterium]